VVDLVRTDERLFTVGRLDKSSEGLILLTNDGELANLLAHPRYGVEKTYLAQVAGHPTAAQLRQLLDGVHLAEGVARVARLRVKKRYKQSTELELVLREGRNREIRRVLAHVGHKVVRLKRVAIGPLRLGDLPAGAHRRLGLDEIQELERAARRGSRSAGKKRSHSGKAQASRNSRRDRQPATATSSSSRAAAKSPKGGRSRMLPAGAGNRAASRGKSSDGKKTTHKATWKKRGR
jgi:23S rRNA pseudouridine2605 synthase